MSERPAVSEPEKSFYQNGSPSNQPVTQTTVLPPLMDSPQSVSPRRGGQGQALEAIQPAAVTADRRTSSSTMASPVQAEQQPIRSLRMDNFLNPTAGAQDQSQQQRTGGQQELPRGAGTNLPPPTYRSAPESPELRGSTGTILPPMNPYRPTYSANGRPPLPSNSSAKRPLELKTMNLPSGTIDAKTSPFVPEDNKGRAFALDPASAGGTSTPLGITPPSTQRHQYGFPSQKASTPPERRVGLNETSQYMTSQSNSPSTSYSSFSQTSRTSPATQYTIPPPQQHPSQIFHGPGHPNNHGRGSEAPQITLGSDSSYGPGSSGVGQNTYQLMTLDTDQGPIQVPVDVQAASKMADEKRKRNAGASARFRQRRKEKERESSTMIGKLESQVREISEERDYYRMERDYFRSLVYNSTAQCHTTPRMPSPRQRKLSQPVMPSAPWQQVGDRGVEVGKNQRRRSSAYSTPIELPQSSAIPPVPPLPYGHHHPPPSPTGPYSYAPPDSRSQTPLGRPMMHGPPPIRPDAYDSPIPPIPGMIKRGIGAKDLFLFSKCDYT